MEPTFRASTPLSSPSRHQRQANASRFPALPLPPPRHDSGRQPARQAGPQQALRGNRHRLPKAVETRKRSLLPVASLKYGLAGRESACDADIEHDSPRRTDYRVSILAPRLTQSLA
jgi:hypothetical protein